jgi:NAD(P)H-flavin reductase
VFDVETETEKSVMLFPLIWIPLSLGLQLTSQFTMSWVTNSEKTLTTFTGQLTGTGTNAYAGIGLGTSGSMNNKLYVPVVERTGTSSCQVSMYTSIGVSIPYYSGSYTSGSCTVTDGTTLNYSFEFEYSAISAYTHIIWAYNLNSLYGGHGGNYGSLTVSFVDGTVSGSTTGSSTSGLAHGVIMAVVFCGIYPFLFFSMKMGVNLGLVHIVLGVVSFPLLIAGWATTPGAGAGEGYLASYHKGLGVAGCWAGILVSIGGFFLVIFGKLKIAVIARKVHGFLGFLIGLIGPLIVWSGWNVWGKYDIPALETQPMVWYSFYLALFCLTVLTRVRLARKARLIKTRFLSEVEFEERLRKGDKLVVYEGMVIDFAEMPHPGGKAALEVHVGKDITEAFKSHGFHGSLAVDMATKYTIGKYTGDKTKLESRDTPEAVLISSKPENETVKTFQFKLTGLNRVGQRIYIHYNGVARPYTAFAIDQTGNAYFAIRKYPQGKVTPYIFALTEGASIKAHVGSVIDEIPLGLKHAVLVAGGTGITPMVAMIKTKPRNCKVNLLWWLKEPSDFFILDEMQALQKIDGVSVSIFFSSNGNNSDSSVPQKNFKCFFESPNPSIFSKALNDEEKRETFSTKMAFICGPEGFCKFVKSQIPIEDCPLENINIIE